ncbi:hypothetical protein B7494_g6583 [Chlorociboria aeruginascens]|nr:hypothetical protein B7494_g6583 [Chlorociboria aeruginascens]
MQSVLGGTMQKASEAVSGAMSSNKKLADFKPNMRHQSADTPVTTDSGVKQSTHDLWLSASTGDRQGPALLEDNYAREKIMRFDHERIPERVVHARGTGAFGNFKLYESAEDVTSAGVLTDTSRNTPVFLRFSTVLGSRGSADTVRDVRGFAVKFYTDEGNWDIVGNDIPVFFIQDAMKFPDVIHAGKPEPDNEVPQAQTAHNNFWDFAYLHSEATHMLMWANSDRGIPRSYRMMQGFGVNTYTLINSEGVRSFVKFHFTPTLGVHSLVWDEALKLAGQDPDFHRKDLMTAIDMGGFPYMEIWDSEELLPVRYIGELQLNRNVDEFFTQTEQAAFCTAHVVPGIGFSDDPLLQGRNFSYFDTQLSRLGVNWQELPVNRPVCPVMNNNRDGALRHKITPGKINYWPNRNSVVPPSSYAEGAYYDYPEKVVAMKQRLHSVKFSEHFSQAQLFYNSLSVYEQAHLTKSLAFELDHCDDPVVYGRMVERISDIDLSLAQAVAEKVGGPIPQSAKRANHGKKAKGLSQADFTPEALGLPPTIASRGVAIIIADGFNLFEYEAVKATLSAAGAFCFTIGSKRQPIIPESGGKGVAADHHFEGVRSTMFDALYIPSGSHATTLLKQGRVIHWIREAFGHCKAIGATGDAVKLVETACAVEGMAFSSSASEVVDSYGVVTGGGVGDGPSGVKEGLRMIKGAKNFMDAFAYAISLHRNFQRELDGLTDLVAF